MVLVCESDEREANLIRSVLQRNAIADVRTFADGEEARQYLLDSAKGKQPVPFAAIVNLILPHANGMEILRLCKNNLQLRHVKVAIVSRSKEENQVQMCYWMGVQTFPSRADRKTEKALAAALSSLLISEPVAASAAAQASGPGSAQSDIAS
jgi:two-component system, response regulator